MTLLPNPSHKTAKPPDAKEEVPVCSALCHASVSHFGIVAGWHS